VNAERPKGPAVDLPAIEHEVAARWADSDLVGATLAQATARPLWSCYTQPSAATGVPGIGYARARTSADLYARFKTMQGMRVPRGHGWDCHGLGVEVAVANELGLSGSRVSEIEAIERYGAERFVARCRESALRHASAFAAVAERLGCMTDQSQIFYTMDRSFIESVWWSLKLTFDAGLLVNEHRIGRYCPRCRTPLAEHEVSGPQVFKRVTGTCVVVRLPIDQRPGAARSSLSGADLLAWTATPWMLPANTGVAVHPREPYVVARRSGHGEKVVLAEARFTRVLGDGWHAVAKLTGGELAGIMYRRPFQVAVPAGGDDTGLVVTDHSVAVHIGTGIAQLSAAYGGGGLPIDRACPVDPIGADGCFDPGVASLAGLFFADADSAVVNDLSDRGLLFAAAPQRRSQAHCWRCGTPILTRAMAAWYIKTSAMLGHDTGDWAVGRTRYWGVPLPIWKCERDHLTCVGSLAELSELAGSDLRGVDPHRPAIDDVVIRCRGCGAQARRVPETLDASYDAAAMMVVAALCNSRVSFRTAICPGGALDERGRPMSGRQGNEADPAELIERHGADAIRWYLTEATANRAAKVPDAAVGRLARRVLGSYLGTAMFFAEYADAIGARLPWLDEAALPVPARPVLDRWLLSELHSAVGTVSAALEMFRPDLAARRIGRFVSDLAGWYVRLSRRRMIEVAAAGQALVVLRTLHDCLDVLTRLMAPIAPHLSDHVWNLIKDQNEPASVHLATWPAKLTALVDDQLNEQMTQVRGIVGVGNAARAATMFGAWQPLAMARLTCEGSDALSPELLTLIADELNVKAVEPVAAVPDADGSPGWLVVSRPAGTVALKLEITARLRLEGIARRSIRVIKEARHRNDLRVSDRIALAWTTNDDEVGAALTEFGPMVSQAVGAIEYRRLVAGHAPVTGAVEHASPDLGATFWLTPLPLVRRLRAAAAPPAATIDPQAAASPHQGLSRDRPRERVTS